MGDTSKKITTGKSGASKKVAATKPVAKKAATAKKSTTPKKVTKKQVADAGDAVVKAAKANKGLIEDTVVKATNGKVTKAEVGTAIDQAPGFWARVKSFLGL